MLIALAPLVIAIAIAGVLLYALASNPKLARIGEIMFAAGLLILVWVLAQHTVRIG